MLPCRMQDPATAGFSFPYMYSKAAIGQATAALAHELLPLGIRVNGIAPGTTMQHSFDDDQTPPLMRFCRIFRDRHDCDGYDG